MYIYIVYYNNLVCSALQMWNNIITIDFMNKDFTEKWRGTFAQDFKGKYQKVLITELCMVKIMIKFYAI